MSYFGTWHGSYFGAWHGAGDAALLAFGGGGSRPKRQAGPRYIYVHYAVEKAADEATNGDFEAVQAALAEAKSLAAKEAASADRENAEALEKISRDILSANRAARKAAESQDRLDEMRAMIALRTTLQAIATAEAKMAREEEEMAVFTLLLMH